jgi:hypothetical protein
VHFIWQPRENRIEQVAGKKKCTFGFLDGRLFRLARISVSPSVLGQRNSRIDNGL